MKTKLIAMITAGAIALTGITAAPASAGQNDELARFLFGAAVIGILVSEANKNNHATVTRHRTPKVSHTPKRTKHAHQRVQKPRQCLRQKQTRSGWKKFYNKNCMSKMGWHKHRKGGAWYKSRHAHR